MQDTLLIEILTEELPPKALFPLANTFGQNIADELSNLNFRDPVSVMQVYATPRRIAVQLSNVGSIQPDQNILRKGPSVKAGLVNGAPSAALTGFARSCGVDVNTLKIMHDGKQDIYCHEFRQKGKSLVEALHEIIPNAIKKLPIPKLMRWSDQPHQFIRPVHGFVLLHGSQVIPGNLFGIKSSNTTLGHRFMSSGLITLKNATDYQKTLREQGKVIAHFISRKAHIQDMLQQAADALQAKIVADEALIDEITGITEYPVVLKAGFDASFLSVPQECLILTMQQNQKYLPLVDAHNKLINQFLLVANLETPNPDNIIHGNERVLRARLSDAAFFFEQDKKHALESRLPKLDHVVYHNKLGSVGQKISRLETLTAEIAKKLGADTAQASRAARLAKADLVTEMVGEFPELQGTMGKYYALHDGEDKEIALAIEQHYQPRFASDELPQSNIAVAVALADKLETLIGIWGIGLIPTGDKDPYALRRAALGVLRMLLGNKLNLPWLLQRTLDTFKEHTLAQDTPEHVYEFMLARLFNLLQNHYSIDVINAVLNTRPEVFNNLIGRLDAVKHFKTLPEAAALAGANKRVHNVLKKNPHETAQVQTEQLLQDEEKTLYQAMQKIRPLVDEHVTKQNFQLALTQLADLKTPIDAFFDNVMVMADDPNVRRNRLNLLEALKTLLNAVADIAELAE